MSMYGILQRKPLRAYVASAVRKFKILSMPSARLLLWNGIRRDCCGFRGKKTAGVLVLLVGLIRKWLDGRMVDEVRT